MTFTLALIIGLVWVTIGFTLWYYTELVFGYAMHTTYPDIVKKIPNPLTILKNRLDVLIFMLFGPTSLMFFLPVTYNIDKRYGNLKEALFCSPGDVYRIRPIKIIKPKKIKKKNARHRSKR